MEKKTFGVIAVNSKSYWLQKVGRRVTFPCVASGAQMVDRQSNRPCSLYFIVYQIAIGVFVVWLGNAHRTACYAYIPQSYPVWIPVRGRFTGAGFTVQNCFLAGCLK